MTVERDKGFHGLVEEHNQLARMLPEDPGSPSWRLFVAAVVVFAVMLASGAVVAGFSFLQ